MVQALASVRAIAPHLSNFFDLVERNICLSELSGTPFHIPPTLLVGPPGVGKTFILKSLAQAMEIAAHVIPCAGFDTFRWKGLNTAWRGARRGKIAEILLDGELANPLVILDEFDKAPANANERPYDSFWDMLEPENATDLRDDYLEITLTANHLNWVGSANDISMIPSPILDRVTIIDVFAPTVEQRGIIIQSVLDEVGRTFGSTLDGKIVADVSQLLSDLSARNIKKVFRTALGFAALDKRRQLFASDVRQALKSVAHGETKKFGFL